LAVGRASRAHRAAAGGGAILPIEGRILPTLNLKNPKAYAMAAELAEMTGETLTSAVMIALARTLDEERKKRGSRSTATEILAFAAKFAPGMAPGSDAGAHANLLYDDDGMPA
jgi:antitoxin VapB